MALKDKTRELIANILKCDLDKIVPQVKLVNDLGADSINIVELVMALEDKFDIDIKEEDAEKFFTVQDVYNYVGKHC